MFKRWRVWGTLGRSRWSSRIPTITTKRSWLKCWVTSRRRLIRRTKKLTPKTTARILRMENINQTPLISSHLVPARRKQTPTTISIFIVISYRILKEKRLKEMEEKSKGWTLGFKRNKYVAGEKWSNVLLVIRYYILFKRGNWSNIIYHHNNIIYSSLVNLRFKYGIFISYMVMGYKILENYYLMCWKFHAALSQPYIFSFCLLEIYICQSLN